ncbi:opioid growth factor receptor-related protein [Leptospira ryugenii]|nr:opioid growth factor receptor-related protein [Leptospira ryugenii]
MKYTSKIIEFYSLRIPDNRNRLLIDIWKQNNHWLEVTHDYIQWLFPLKEKSQFNENAPILKNEDIAEFSNNEFLKENLKKSFLVLLRFYGLRLREENRLFLTEYDESFQIRKNVWLTPGNHNHLRITRILKSLSLLALNDYAKSFFLCLEDIYKADKQKISKITFSFWKEAIE